MGVEATAYKSIHGIYKSVWKPAILGLVKLVYPCGTNDSDWRSVVNRHRIILLVFHCLALDTGNRIGGYLLCGLTKTKKIHALLVDMVIKKAIPDIADNVFLNIAYLI